MRLKYTLTACSDCVCFVANGDIPNNRPNLPDIICDYLGGDYTLNHLVNADETGEDWFSWSRCECCGDTQGGMRNRLAILEE